MSDVHRQQVQWRCWFCGHWFPLNKQNALTDCPDQLCTDARAVLHSHASEAPRNAVDVGRAIIAKNRRVLDRLE